MQTHTQVAIGIFLHAAETASTDETVQNATFLGLRARELICTLNESDMRSYRDIVESLNDLMVAPDELGLQNEAAVRADVIAMLHRLQMTPVELSRIRLESVTKKIALQLQLKPF